jgi:hypothetical protein
MEETDRSRAAKLQHNNAGSFFGRKTMNLTEVAVQCDEHTPFCFAGLKNGLIGSAEQTLLMKRS